MSEKDIIVKERGQDLDLAAIHFFIKTFSFLWRDKWKEARAERRAEEANIAHRLAKQGINVAEMNVQRRRNEAKKRSAEPSFLASNDFLIIEDPTIEERQEFQKYIQRGSIEVENGKVYVMYPTNDGGTFRAGSINLDNGWVISDMPYGRMSGFPLYIAREIAGWQDPTGQSGSEKVSRIKPVTNEKPSVSVEKKSKDKNPYAPVSRKQRRFRNDL